LLAREIVPVSSETTTTTASVCSLSPSAARCRVPSPAPSGTFSLSGKTQAAAATRSPCTITAPSCRAELRKKMETSRSTDTAPSMRTPVATYSCRPVVRSMAISPP
jgi:hypothetical protein